MEVDIVYAHSTEYAIKYFKGISNDGKEMLRGLIESEVYKGWIPVELDVVLQYSPDLIIQEVKPESLYNPDYII